MCVICALPEGTVITEEEFERCWRANSHGFGFSYVNKDNRVVIDKAMELKEAKEKFFETFDRFKDTTPFMLHFRIKTHGDPCLDNTHPFWVAEGKLAFCHNGVINEHLPHHQDSRSDTRVFGDEILKRLPEGFQDDVPTMKMMGKYIGGSKLCFIDYRRDMRIVNVQHGTWDKERWFSNTSFRGYSGNTGPTTPYIPTRSGSTPHSTAVSGTKTPEPAAPQTGTQSAVQEHTNRVNAARQQHYADVMKSQGFLGVLPTPWNACGEDDEACGEPEVKQANHYQLQYPKEIAKHSSSNPDQSTTPADYRFCKECGSHVDEEEFDDDWRRCAECVMPYIEYLEVDRGAYVITDKNGKGIRLKDCKTNCAGIQLDCGVRCIHWSVESSKILAQQLSQTGKVTITTVGDAKQEDAKPMTLDDFSRRPGMSAANPGITVEEGEVGLAI